MKTEDRSQWRTTTKNARLKIFDVGSTTNCLSLCSLRSNIYMYNNRNTPRYLVMLEMPLSTTPTMTKSVSKTIKTRAGRFEWKSERSAKCCGLYANGRIMIGRSYLASRQVAILPKTTELALRYCLGTSVRRNGSLCVLRPVATFASRLRNVPAGSEYVYRPIRCVSPVLPLFVLAHPGLDCPCL